MESWIEWFPDRFEEELESYRRNSIEVHIDEDLKSRGILALNAIFKEHEATHKIRIEYPSLFPYFQPMAFLLEEQLDRHQSPFGGHLCLLGRGTDQWSSSDNFGDILAERFPIILQINREADLTKKAALEEPQGEPFTEYLNGSGIRGSALLYQDSWELPSEAKMGMATLTCAHAPGGKKSAAPLVGFVRSIRKKADILAEWDGPQFRQFSTNVHVPWVRLDAPPKGTLIDNLSDPQKSHIGWGRSKRNQAITFLMIFPEEAEQFKYRDGIACVSLHPLIQGSRKGKSITYKPYFQRTFRAGIAELQARMPAISELSGKCVAIFGLGALGSFVATELARAGVGQLRLVDFDYVEPATVRRWALGASSFGQQKAVALADHIATEYPWTVLEPIDDLKIGDISTPGDSRNQFNEIVNVIEKVDLVLDLTAEFGANEFLSMLCGRMKTPYLRGSATPGAWGGYLAYFQQQEGEACWPCMTHDLYGEKWSDDLPPSDPAGTMQPPGCPSITFTGTSVDLQELSLEVVRQSFGILTESYSLPTGQLSILSHRDAEGRRLMPEWINRPINRREKCSCN